MNETRICKECGQPFQATNGMQQYCKLQHFRNCVVCGQSFEITLYHLTAKDARVTCSRKCSAILRKRTNLDKYGGVAPACSSDVQAKMKSTNMERYGTESPIQLDEFKQKAKQTSLEKYGVEHHTQTASGRKAISDRWSDPEYRQRVLASIEETMLERYGVKCVFSSPEIQNQMREDYFKRTGYYHPFSNPEVRKHIQDVLMEKFGVTSPLQSEQLLNKMIATNQERYGVSFTMQSRDVKERAKATCRERYGYDNYLQSPEGKQRVANTMLNKYGVRFYSQTDDFKLRVMSNPDKIDNLVEFDNNPENYILTHFDSIPSLTEVADSIGTGTEAVSVRLNKAGCTNLVRYVYSQMEDEVYSELINISPDASIVRNTKKIITPYEIDIFLPDYNLGIECNPTSTHNSSINTWCIEDSPIPRRYHQMKSDMCDEKGIQLFHIFGYEWKNNRDVIISMLRNLLKHNTRTIYGRETQIKEVSGVEAAEFLDNNHRQGNTFSNVRLGLYTKENELVSIMTFGKMRATIGTSKEDLSDCYELVRFCSKVNTSVVGAASKLFAYFLKTYSPKRVRSFSDRAHTSGKLYQTLGFNEVRRSDPGYVWVNLYNDRAYHRVNAQKHNLKKFLNDENIDLSQTEAQIMISHNFVQVFDSGTITWEWNNTEHR